MAEARGKTKQILIMVGEIQTLIEKAHAVIDTNNQYEIRKNLAEAQEKCIEVRNFYDPV